jgi:hypothetical protein
VALIASTSGRLRNNGRISKSLSLARKAGLVLAADPPVASAPLRGKKKPIQQQCNKGVLDLLLFRHQ